MIKYKVPLEYKYYLLGNVAKLLDSVVDKVMFILLIPIIFFNLLLENYLLTISLILLFIILIFGIPLYKYILAIKRFKLSEIEYYFGAKVFGYTIGDYKLEIKMDKIEYIKLDKHVIQIRINKQTLRFLITANNLKKVEDKLMKSSYRKLIM